MHEQFTTQVLRDFRDWNPGLKIIANPVCPPEVVAEADYAGSTANIQGWVEREKPSQVILVTECSMVSNISDANPEVELLGPCNMCAYKRKISLEKVLWSLHSMTAVVEVDPAVAEPARRAVQRMNDLSQRSGRVMQRLSRGRLVFLGAGMAALSAALRLGGWHAVRC